MLPRVASPPGRAQSPSDISGGMSFQPDASEAAGALGGTSASAARAGIEGASSPAALEGMESRPASREAWGGSEEEGGVVPGPAGKKATAPAAGSSSTLGPRAGKNLGGPSTAGQSTARGGVRSGSSTLLGAVTGGDAPTLLSVESDEAMQTVGGGPSARVITSRPARPAPCMRSTSSTTPRQPLTQEEAAIATDITSLNARLARAQHRLASARAACRIQTTVAAATTQQAATQQAATQQEGGAQEGGASSRVENIRQSAQARVEAATAAASALTSAESASSLLSIESDPSLQIASGHPVPTQVVLPLPAARGAVPALDVQSAGEAATAGNPIAGLLSARSRASVPELEATDAESPVRRGAAEADGGAAATPAMTPTQPEEPAASTHVDSLRARLQASRARLHNTRSVLEQLQKKPADEESSSSAPGAAAGGDEAAHEAASSTPPPAADEVEM